MKALAKQYLEDPEGYDMLSKDQPTKEQNSFSQGRGSGYFSSARGSGVVPQGGNYLDRFNFGSKVSDTASGYLDRIKPKEENTSQITDAEEFNETFTLFKTVSVLGPGDSFGEMALVSNK